MVNPNTLGGKPKVYGRTNLGGKPRLSCIEERSQGEKKNRREVTHPLEHFWTFWFNNPSTNKSRQVAWGNSMRPIYTFSTIEEF